MLLALTPATTAPRVRCSTLTTRQLHQNIGELLDVPAGQLGLRQSDALFQHVKKLPGLLDRLMTAKQGDIVAVGVSDRPRRQEGSYMPCFLAGVSSARSIAAALGLEACFFSHQEGHIASALYSAGRLKLDGQAVFVVASVRRHDRAALCPLIEPRSHGCTGHRRDPRHRRRPAD